jgi:phosphate transport system permease protein
VSLQAASEARLVLKPRAVAGRRATNAAVKVLAWIAASFGIAVMVLVVATVVVRGIAVINWDFFTQLPPTSPTQTSGAGLGNAIVGTLLIVGAATLMGIPAGFFAGVYLAEYGRTSRTATFVRVTANMLVGIPSIVIGVFVYALLVKPMHSYSLWAGAFALAVIMLPVMARTAEDMMNLVPNELRESALALGAPRWKVTLGVVVKAARNGLLTGGLLAIVRVSGETAPLLFTVLNSQFWPQLGNLKQPTANLTVSIYSLATSPYRYWIQLAWGGALVIIVAVLGMNILTRLLFGKRRDW